MATSIAPMQAKRKQKASRSAKPSNTPSTMLMLNSQLLALGRFNEGLPTFITKGLDSEQIWQQIELRNDHKLSLGTCTKEIVRISESQKKRKKKTIPSVLDKEDKEEVEGSSSDSDVDDMLGRIKERLSKTTGDDDDADLDNLLSDGSDEDGLDFDFEVEKELSKAASGDESENESEKPVKKKSIKQKAKRTSVVDDKFFKLADMEQFLEEEDMKEEKKLKKNKKGSDNQSDADSSDESSEDDDEDIDMFADEPEEDKMGEARYKDFFDPPDDAEKRGHEDIEEKDEDVEMESDLSDAGSHDSQDVSNQDMDGREDARADNEDEEDDAIDEEEDAIDEEDDAIDEEEDAIDEEDNAIDEEEDNEREEISKSKKKVKFSNDLLESDEDDKTEEAKGSKHDVKSTFEMKQEKLEEKAREMEDKSLKEASWELTGEVTSSKRPENSLLETVLDFQHTTRAAPVITDDFTKTIEDYVKQRIKDKTFDDVERKEKPKEDVFEFKKRIVLDQEKSKQSLGELYEQEFLKLQRQDEEEVKADPECEKIEKSLEKLFYQLDALSNFHYKPMKPGTEVKITVNTPAIAMEEVAPVATTDAELLAPEEIHEKKRGGLKADDERDSTDKKRERRQKKKDKRLKKKAKEQKVKAVEKLNPGLGNKYSKQNALKKLEEIGKSDKSVSFIKGDGQKQNLTSSTSFFTQLQEEVQTNAKAKKGSSKKKKEKVDASKVML